MEKQFHQVTNNLGTVMKHDFSKVPQADIPRSSFNRSHSHKTTFNAGLLIPVFLDEVLPGDTFNLDATFFARLSTPIFPIMDNLFLDSFFFFVPNRLVWDNWEKQNGAQDAPGDSTDFLEPTVPVGLGGIIPGSLADYFGIPYSSTAAVFTHVSALPWRAHNLIWNEWFRDQNLQNSVVVQKDDGPDTLANYGVYRRGKRHDYFTSALPWPQKGDAVTLPLGSSAPIVQTAPITFPVNSVFGDVDGNLGQLQAGLNSDQSLTSFIPAASGAQNAQLSFLSYAYPNTIGGMKADLSAATAATINAIRFAFQMQKLLERDARGGTRFTEILRFHFGVISPDSRLQRPEYLGGGETPINIHPVAQTAATSITSPQGNLAGFGTAVSHHGHNHGFTKSFVEHGWVIGYVSVRADLTYQQGIERMWWRQTRFDRYWPVFAHLGEQTILNREIYATGDGSAQDTDVFGYQEAWAEYRYKPSRISGLFRSNLNGAQTLDSWHLSQDFGSLPTLSSTFIQDSPPMARVEAVPTEPDFIFDSYFNFICARPMPVYSVPGLIDHF